MKIFALIISATLTILSGCTKEPDPSITIGTRRMNFDVEGGSSSVSLNSVYPWAASTHESWINLEIDGGKEGNSKVNFTVDANSTPDDRTGYIIFTSRTVSDTLAITQHQKDKIIIDGQTEYVIGCDGGVITIELSANIDYTVETGADWIIRNRTKGLVRYSEEFSIMENESYYDRESFLTFCGNGLEETIHIIQKKVNYLKTDADSTLYVSAPGESFSIDVTTNLEYEVLIDEEWIRQIDTKGLRTESLQFIADENLSGKDRQAIIKLKSIESDDEKTVIVSQGSTKLLRMTISGDHFIVPELTREYGKAIVEWGDGECEEYTNGLYHKYVSEGTYSVIIKCDGASDFNLKNLIGLDVIDLSAY